MVELLDYRAFGDHMLNVFSLELWTSKTADPDIVKNEKARSKKLEIIEICLITGRLLS